jgi:hypothetical protein
MERLEADRRALRIRAVIDTAIYVSDGVQADLDRVLDGECYVSDGEPVLAVRATESVHTTANPLQPQEGSARRIQGQLPAPDDNTLVSQAAPKENLPLTPGSPVEAEVVLLTLPEQEPADRGLLFGDGDTNRLGRKIP